MGAEMFQDPAYQRTYALNTAYSATSTEELMAGVIRALVYVGDRIDALAQLPGSTVEMTPAVAEALAEFIFDDARLRGEVS